jgi:hypothetical protein
MNRKRKRAAERELVLRRIELVKNELARREREASTADSIIKTNNSEEKRIELNDPISINQNELELCSSSDLSNQATSLPESTVSTGGKGPLETEEKVPYWLQEEILTGMEQLEGDSYYVATDIIQDHFDGKLVSDSEIDIEQLPPACVNKLVTFIRHTLKTQNKVKQESEKEQVITEQVAKRGKVLVESKIETTPVKEEQPQKIEGGKTIKLEDEPDISNADKTIMLEYKPSEKDQDSSAAAVEKKLSDETEAEGESVKIESS